jgi:hypothetical protein
VSITLPRPTFSDNCTATEFIERANASRSVTLP